MQMPGPRIAAAESGLRGQQSLSRPVVVAGLAIEVLGIALLAMHWSDLAWFEIGVWAVFLFVAIPFCWRAARAYCAVCLSTSVAETVRAEERARLSQAQLAKILDSVNDPIIAIDEAGVVLNANPAVEKVFGWAPGELVGENVSVLMAEPYGSEHDRYIETYLRTGVKHAIGRLRKVTGQRKAGDAFPCVISISEVSPPSPARFVGVIRDTSDTEELSAKLALTERLAAIGELAAGVAHEINNPVNTILNCAQLLKDGEQDPVLTDDILHEGNRIATIVSGLLDFAKDRTEHFNPTSIHEVVESTLSLIQRRILKTGIELSIDVPEDLPSVMARFHQLQQVLMNLVLNARDALIDKRGEDAKIEIIAACQPNCEAPERIVVKVRDNGVGIPADRLDRIFNPFYTTKRDRGGTGLGLSVSLGIVKSHSGRLYANCVPGECTEFVMELPVEAGGG